MPDTSDARPPVGALEQDKRAEDTSDPGHPQPTAPEVESARLLANEARGELEADGLAYDEIRRYADDFIALDLGEGTQEFIRWVRRRFREGEGTGTSAR